MVATMRKYYFLHYTTEETLGFGYTEEVYEFDHLKEGQRYENWVPPTFMLKNGGYADYQVNDLDWPLCSEKLKNIIEQYASPHDIIQWLGARVVSQEGEKRDYYVLHLPDRPDVLNKKKTVFAAEDVVIKPYFSGKAVSNHCVFSYPDGGFHVVVSEEVLDAILSAGCTGLDFYEARIA
jgi:hypothetical protein